MSVLETTLVFVLIPLAVAGLLALLTLGAGGSRTARYRPGMPFEFTPVWFLSAPPASAGALLGGHAAIESTPSHGELPDGSASVRNSGPKGGARGTW
jgi:hypothetical protein